MCVCSSGWCFSAASVCNPHGILPLPPGPFHLLLSCVKKRPQGAWLSPEGAKMPLFGDPTAIRCCVKLPADSGKHH